MNVLIKILLVIAAIGAINWGLVGFFQWNLIAAIFTGEGFEAASAGGRVIYAIVGIAGLVALFALPKLETVTHRTRGGATA